MSAPETASTRLTTTQWLICVIASIGFAFDIYELLMLPLVVGPALSELIHAAPGSDLFNAWVGRLFYIPALAGGLFGLLGGYLTDRLGRRRVLTWSILIYAFSAFAASCLVQPTIATASSTAASEPRTLMTFMTALMGFVHKKLLGRIRALIPSGFAQEPKDLQFGTPMHKTRWRPPSYLDQPRDGGFGLCSRKR